MNSHPLDGEIVEVTGFRCIARGHSKEYSAFCEMVSPDTGKPIQIASISFNERVAETFRKAGHMQVKYSFGHQITSLAHIEVELGTKETRRGATYTINSVCGLDGKTFYPVVYPERIEIAPRKKVIETWKADIEIEAWLRGALNHHADCTPSLLKPQYGWNRVKGASFKQANGGMHVMSLKAKGQPFVQEKKAKVA